MNEDKNIQAVDSELSVDNVQEHLELLNEEAESAAATPADKDYSTLTLNEILDTATEDCIQLHCAKKRFIQLSLIND